MITFDRENANTIRWAFMDQSTDGDYVNDATVTATLKVDSTNAVVSNFSSIALAYVASSNGRYVGSVAASVFPSSLTLGTDYRLEVSATVSGTLVAFRKIPAQVVERTT